MSGRNTKRDIALLESLCRCGFMSFQQLASRHFGGLHKSTIHNRLTLLEQRGLITRMRVGRLIYGIESRDIGVVFQPTKTAMALIVSKEPNLELKGQLVSVSSIDLYHDLVLTDALEALGCRFGSDFRNCKTLPKQFLPLGRIPDAALLSPSGSLRLAIELEVTAKSEQRYREIITSYRVNPKVEKVLYLTATKGIRDKLTNILAYKPLPSLPKPRTGKFFFANLNQLLADPKGSPVTNGDEELRIEECQTKEIA